MAAGLVDSIKVKLDEALVAQGLKKAMEEKKEEL
jgi:hypothetical protein